MIGVHLGLHLRERRPQLIDQKRAHISVLMVGLKNRYAMLQLGED